MKFAISRVLPLVLWTASASAQSRKDEQDGYIGYRLEKRGDPESAIYETANTDSGVDIIDPEPDVYLNASVSVGVIDIEVDNITAKVNLDAQVLNLLRINAGVDASIDRVRLAIEDVRARVELEARLENVLRMVDDVLTSIDLNPVLATLGQVVNETLDTVTDTLTGGGTNNEYSNNNPAKRSSDLPYNLEHNVLYSVNDYRGNAHRNRVLAQNGDLYDEYLDNGGNELRREIVGHYARDMVFTGHNRTVEVDGDGDGKGSVEEFELQYRYGPFPGLEVTCLVYVDAADPGRVTRTRVVAEAQGGGTSTVSNDSES